MTDNDKLFLNTLQAISRSNREIDRDPNGSNQSKQTLRTSKSLLSDELLRVFDVGQNDPGAWVFNVYVEFEPAFRSVDAKDWQQ